MKEEEEFLLKTGTSKDSQRFAPYQNKPFCGPHKTRKEAPTRNAPMAPRVVFDPTIGDEGVETPPPMTPSKPPSVHQYEVTSVLSSNVLNIITNGYVLPFLSKPNLVRFSLILSEYKTLQKDQALANCIQSLLSKNAIKRVENVKSLGF